MSNEVSDYSRTSTLLFAGILGMFGAHRFYTGRTTSGVWMALTLGGAGIWYLYDIIQVATGVFRDGEGRIVSNWDVDTRPRVDASAEVLEELDFLRREVAELHERVDFTERLLAAGRREGEKAIEK